jgi:hypothetical protein
MKETYDRDVVDLLEADAEIFRSTHEYPESGTTGGGLFFITFMAKIFSLHMVAY